MGKCSSKMCVNVGSAPEFTGVGKSRSMTSN